MSQYNTMKIGILSRGPQNRSTHRFSEAALTAGYTVAILFPKRLTFESNAFAFANEFDKHVYTSYNFRREN